jgi:hypothetical protein
MRVRRAFLLTPVFLLLFVGIAMAQQPSLVGTWEAYQFDGKEGFAYRWVLRLYDDGSFERFALSSDPEQPFARDAGLYALTDSQLELILTTDFILGGTRYSFSSNLDTLSWMDESSILLLRGYEVDPAAMIGTWHFYGPDGNPTGGQITLGEDGIYHSDLSGSLETGPYFVVGSGMVHWPVETNEPKLLGVPGVWTDIRVEGDRMSYVIMEGYRVSALREGPTVVAPISWGALKHSR